MKKILMLNYEFPPLGGGAGNATKYLLREFSRFDNLEIDLVTSSTDKFRIENFSKNIRIFYIDIGKNGNIHYQSNRDLIIYSWKAFWFCLGMKSRTKYDFVHAFFGIPCGFIAMILRLPYIVSLRGTDVPFYNERYFWFDFFVFRFFSRLIWKKSRFVIANSGDLKELAQKNRPKQEIQIISNGVDLNEIHPVKKQESDFVVISTSRLIERKGVRFLVEAFARLSKKYSNVKLIVAGDGGLKIELEGISSKDIENGNIKFLGAISHNKVLELYKESDVFVLPSLNEGMSNSMLEAMASGLAIITTDTGGARDLIDDDNGSLIAEKNSDNIFKALEMMYLDREKLEQMKIESRKRVECMGWDNVAKKYFEIYGKC